MSWSSRIPDSKFSLGLLIRRGHVRLSGNCQTQGCIEHFGRSGCCSLNEVSTPRGKLSHLILECRILSVDTPSVNLIACSIKVGKSTCISSNFWYDTEIKD